MEGWWWDSPIPRIEVDDEAEISAKYYRAIDRLTIQVPCF